jgi:hypothetical protein
VAILPKKKALQKANYLLIPRLFSRFSLEKEAQRKANKRKGRYQGLRALDRANFLKKLDKTFCGWVCANNSINPNLSNFRTR